MKQTFINLLKIMLRLLEKLPVELVGANVLAYLSLKDIVMLERACSSRISHQLFLYLIPYCPPVVLPSCKHTNESVLRWFVNMKCKIESLTIHIPGGNPGLNMSNLLPLVLSFDLQINYHSPIESYKPLLNNEVGERDQNREVMEQLSDCTGNVKKLTIRNSNNCMDWLNVDVLSRWKLTELSFSEASIATSLVLLIVQTCTELTSIKVEFSTVHDAAVITIAQHCPKLETLQLWSSNITWTSLLALSERGLPLEELDIYPIPNIPAVDIARRCSHALSCIHYIRTSGLHSNDQDASILMPYLTGLTGVDLDYYDDAYIPLLRQHCHKLLNIYVEHKYYTVADILSLCRANPLLERLSNVSFGGMVITNNILIELIHACPHLHSFNLPYEYAITDIGILALSVHCPEMQMLDISKCFNVTEAAVLQLLQHCRKLTRLKRPGHS